MSQSAKLILFNPPNPKNPGSDNIMKHADITGKIIGAAMELHRILGKGFQEVIYQRALEIELQLVGLSFKREFEMDIFIKERR